MAHYRVWHAGTAASAKMSASMNKFRSIAVLAAAACTTAWAASGNGTQKMRAEVQVLLCGEPAAIERALALQPRDVSYETWLFDTPTLALLDRGVRVRLRYKSGASELTVKVGAQDCRSLAMGRLPQHEGKCEYDVYGQKTDGVVSLTKKVDDATARALIKGTTPVFSALSGAQMRFLNEAVRLDPIPADVRPLGPIANRVFATSDGYSLDDSQMPGGERFVEISTKVPLPKADAAMKTLDARLRQAGVATCADQTGPSAAKLRLLVQRR
jgi:hypothetical protein